MPQWASVFPGEGAASLFPLDFSPSHVSGCGSLGPSLWLLCGGDHRGPLDRGLSREGLSKTRSQRCWGTSWTSLWSKHESVLEARAPAGLLLPTPGGLRLVPRRVLGGPCTRAVSFPAAQQAWKGPQCASDLGCGAAGRLPGPCVRGPAADCRIEEGRVRSALGLLGFLSVFFVSIPAWRVLGTDLVSLCRNRPGSELCAHGGVFPVTDPVRLGLGPSAGDTGTGWP